MDVKKLFIIFYEVSEISRIRKRHTLELYSIRKSDP